MAGAAGKVALVNKTTALTGTGITDPNVIDYVGYGTTATPFEGTGSSLAPSATTSILRKSEDGTPSAIGKGAGWDTNDNKTDFTTGTPIPRNSSTPPVVVVKSSPPNGNLIEFNGQAGTVKGYAGAAAASTQISLYVSDPSSGGVEATASIPAGTDGSYINL